MNILHVYRTFINDTVGGIEQVIAQAIMARQSADISYRVVSLSRKPYPRELPFSCATNLRYRENFSIASNSVSFELLADFGKLVKDADVVHYHFPWPFADLLHLAWRVNKPTVLTYHSDIVRQQGLLKLYRPVKHAFLRSVDAIVATSPNYLETSQVLQRYREKVRVIPIGLDKASYPVPAAERLDYWRGRFGNRFFLFVGLIRYYKGLHILLEAVHGTEFPVVIVGAGPVEAELKAHAARLGLKHVFFLGSLSEEDKVALLTLCLSVVFPSHLRAEAFGVSLLEGAMYGKPLISSEIGTGTSYINADGKTGFVVPPSDPVAFRAAMQRIWDRPDEAKAMGERAEARYWELFTADKMASGYEALYRELTAAVGRPVSSRPWATSQEAE